MKYDPAAVRSALEETEPMRPPFHHGELISQHENGDDRDFEDVAFRDTTSLKFSPRRSLLCQRDSLWSTATGYVVIDKTVRSEIAKLRKFPFDNAITAETDTGVNRTEAVK